MAANQPVPARPWFRLPSIARPATAPAPTPAPEPPPPQPRPILARPSFRPIGLPQPPPTQPQEPAPPPPAVTLAPPVASPPPATREAGGTASVPGSPIIRAPAASLPTSPARTSVAVPPAAASSTVPSPGKRVPAGTSSVPSSPALKLAPTSSSVPSSPALRPAPSSSVPTSPIAKTAPITSSVATSPAPKAVVATILPAPFPRTILNAAVQTPPQSPKAKPTAPPPSPLTLPPSQIKSYAEQEPKIPLEAEQKTVVVQKTIGKPSGWPWSDSTDSERNLPDGRKPTAAHIPREEHFKEIEKRGSKGHGKKVSSDSEDVGMRVITIAGENKGASMEIFNSPKKNAFEGNPHHLHKTGNPKTIANEWSSRSSSDEEKNPRVKDKNHKGMAVNSPPMSAFMNSNVQGVNNSIVYQSSYTHHDPGVHLSVSRKPAAGGLNVKEHGNGHQS